MKNLVGAGGAKAKTESGEGSVADSSVPHRTNIHSVVSPNKGKSN